MCAALFWCKGHLMRGANGSGLFVLTNRDSNIIQTRFTIQTKGKLAWRAT